MKGGQCGAPLMGGKRRSRRRLRGGMYGFGGEAIAPGTLVAGAAYTGAADPKTGAAVPDPALKGTPSAGSYTGLGGRRRKSRKGSKKSRRGTRKMKGGAPSISAGQVGYGFTGAGAAGIADAVRTTQNGNAY
jgi:hypothetical protein